MSDTLDSDDEGSTTYIESYRTIHAEFGRIADVFYQPKTPERLETVQRIHSDSKWKRYLHYPEGAEMEQFAVKLLADLKNRTIISNGVWTGRRAKSRVAPLNFMYPNEILTSE